MNSIKIIIAFVLLIGLTYSQQQTNTFNLKPVKRGFTLQATKFPTYETGWAGRFSCNNCNPFEGDQLCNKSLPLVCITHAKSIYRPLYPVAV